MTESQSSAEVVSQEKDGSELPQLKFETVVSEALLAEEYHLQ
jgi:hypothetical protein